MRRISEILSPVKRVVVFLVFALSVVAVFGAFIYALYTVAVKNRVLYSRIFLAVFAATVLFFVLRSVRRKTFLKAVMRWVRFLYGLFVVCAVVALFLFLGALFVRVPLAGMIAAPPVIGGVVFLFLRWNPFHFLKNSAE